MNSERKPFVDMNQKKFAIFLAAISLCFSNAALAQSPKATQSTSAKAETLADLQAQLRAHIDLPRFALAQWGIKVVSLDTGKILFERNADKLMKPASNTKMYSGSLALDRLGPNYQIKTSFYAASKPDADGTIHGDLIVYGRGDPSFAARFNDGDYKKSLQPILQALAAAGIKKIEGDLIGDESFFRGPPLGTDWAWDDLQYYYGAEFSALTVEDNVIDLVFKPGEKIGDPCHLITKPETTFVNFSNRTTTAPKGVKASIDLYRPIGENVVYVHGQVPIGGSHTDAVTVHTPALWFVTLLKEELAQCGVSVSGKLRTANWLDREIAPLDFSKLIEVAFVESRPISEIVKRMTHDEAVAKSLRAFAPAPGRGKNARRKKKN